jgi:hypothetical protein
LRSLAFDKGVSEWKVGVEANTTDGMVLAAGEIVLFTNTLNYTTSALRVADVARVYRGTTNERIAAIYRTGDRALADRWASDNDVAVIDRLVANGVRLGNLGSRTARGTSEGVETVVKWATEVSIQAATVSP